MISVDQMALQPNGITRPAFLPLHRSIKAQLNPVRRALKHSELKLLIKEITEGVHKIVTLNKRMLSNQHLVDIIIACASKNAKVEEIMVAENEITASAIRDLIPYLSANTTIKKLNLSENSINSDVLGFFSQILEKNSTLIDITLSMNPIKEADLKPLQELLNKNKAKADYDAKIKAEFAFELTKSEGYDSTISVLSSVNFSAPVCSLVLDYFNESSTEEARKKISELLYPKSSMSNIDVSSQQKTNPDVESLKLRMESLAPQFDASSSKLEAFEQDEKSRLLEFSKKPIEESDPHCLSLSKLSCPCVIL